MIKFNETLECDVFIAGGGTAGLMAAINACENGADVIVAEKANTERSGATATGNDHFQCYVPEVHGSEEDWLRLFMHDRPGGQNMDWDAIPIFMREGFPIAQRWEEWGIPMRPHGYWEMQGHCIPGVQSTHLKFAGRDMKRVLTREAVKAGAKILNRCPLTEIITDDEGHVCGALCVDVSTEEVAVQVIRCKAMIICASGVGKRLRGSDRSGWMFNLANPTSMTGDALAAAYRAGAEIVGGRMRSIKDAPLLAASRFMSRGGKNTWVGIHTNIYGEPISSRFTKPDWRLGPCDSYLDPEYDTHYLKGEPIFLNMMDCTKEDMDYMLWALPHEGQGATLDHLAAEGFDFKKHMIEWCDGISGAAHPGGIYAVNNKFETTIPGVYVASGAANSMPALSGAAVAGTITGRHAAEYIKGREFKAAEKSDLVEKCAEHYSRLLSNPADDSSPTWYEANVAIQQVMLAYAGTGVVSEELFEVGLQHLDRLRKKFENLQAGNAHDFMRCMEVESLAVCAELGILECRARKETRGSTLYANYPDKDPAWNGKRPSIRLVNGENVFGRRGKRTECSEFDIGKY